MAPPRMRPRFELVVPTTPGATLDGFRRYLNGASAGCTGSITGRHVRFRIPEARRHTWTPQLDLEVEPHEAGSLVRGLFGPHPSIWTFIVALYAIIGFSALGGLIFAYSQWTLGQAPTALWSVPVALVLAGGVYMVALVGQGLSQAQMIELRGCLDEALRGDEVLK